MADLRKIIFAGVSLCLASVLTTGLVLRKCDIRKSVSKLEMQLEEARKREEKAVMVRSVSKQMEEIAYQQKGISDRQRKEAEVQAEENFRMKLRVEKEWKRAVKAQEEAVKAYQLADRQKALAEERQVQAEYAKRVADTLTYLTLGRSLGSLSITQYKAGNYEVASLLAYSSWNFVRRYHGNTFLSSVFNALSLSSGQPSVWQKHQGGITSIVITDNSKNEAVLYTVSKYGEIVAWKKGLSDVYQPEVLLADPQYDFRAACADANKLYVLSYDGKVLRLSKEKPVHIFTTERKGYTGMLLLDGQPLLLSTAGDIFYAESKKKFCDLTDVTCMCMANNAHGLFAGCKSGDIFLIDVAGNSQRLGNYYDAAVTALCHNPERELLAVGYTDGTLLITGTNENNIQQLIAHRAAISGICILKDKLYSCSYDRTLRLWNLTTERQEAVTVLESSSWLQAMAFSLDGTVLFGGDGNGVFYQMSVSPDYMATQIQKKLSRNFTSGEWTYYMGNQIPFETYAPELTP